MKRLILAAIVGLALMGGCQRGPRTTYTIEYRFDNTEIQSDFLSAYEYKDSLHNGKYRTSHHRLDTIMVDGMPHEYASGRIEEVAHDGANGIRLTLSGFRPGIGGEWILDSLFALTPDEETLIVIGDEAEWLGSGDWYSKH